MPSLHSPSAFSHIAVITGAGMSAESGLQTFRGQNGLWEGHRIEDVATPQAWHKNPALVLEFYNQRRKALNQAQPNAGHFALAQLESKYRVSIVTQNVDDLHERAGSSSVLHLHGELRKARSTAKESLVIDLDGPLLNVGDTCPLGSQLRPHIVWFGEDVPAMNDAIPMVESADMVVVVGTSLQVYPAASLLQFAKQEAPIILIDPEAHVPYALQNLTILRGTAGELLPELVKQWLSEAAK